MGKKCNETFGPQNIPELFPNHYLIAFQKNQLEKNLTMYV